MEKKVVLFVSVLFVFLALFSYKLVLLTFSYGGEQLDVVKYVQGRGQLSGGFNEREVSHLADVKAVMFWFDILFLMSFVGVLFLGWMRHNLLGSGLFYGGVTLIIFVLFVGVLSLFSFNWVFDMFHRLFFVSGSWLFAEDSKIIQLFPLSFFVKIARNIFVLSGILGLVSFGMGFFITKKEKASV
jgi:integral membrane protein (TIGR01906 family)